MQMLRALFGRLKEALTKQTKISMYLVVKSKPRRPGRELSGGVGHLYTTSIHNRNYIHMSLAKSSPKLTNPLQLAAAPKMLCGKAIISFVQYFMCVSVFIRQLQYSICFTNRSSNVYT